MRRVIATSAAALLLLAGCTKPVEVDDPPTTTPASTGTSTPAPAPPSGPATLRIGISFDQPGIGQRGGDTYSGLDVDIARYVASQLGAAQVVFVEAAPDQRDTILTTGQADLVLGSYSISRDREHKVTFAGPYLTTGQDLLVRRGSSIRGLADLRGHSLCSATGSASTDELVADHPGMRIVERRSVAECVAALRDGDVNAVTSDTAILAGFADTSDSTQPRSRQVVLLRRPFTTEHYGIAVSHGDLTRCEEVTDALKEMERSGAWEKAVKDNLPGAKNWHRPTTTAPTLRPCRVINSTTSSSATGDESTTPPWSTTAPPAPSSSSR